MCSAKDEKIKKLEGKVHELNLVKGDLMSAKNAMMHEHSQIVSMFMNLRHTLKS